MKLLKKPMPSAGRWNSMGRPVVRCMAALCCAAAFAAGAAQAPEAPSSRVLSGEQIKIRVIVGGQERSATPADNASAAAFCGLLAKGPLTIPMQDYGGFEKVGPLGTSIVRSDEDIAAVPGDIILYQGDKVTVYYGKNRWTFTRLGHIDGATGENMRAFLGDADPAVTFSLAE